MENNNNNKDDCSNSSLDLSFEHGYEIIKGLQLLANTRLKLLNEFGDCLTDEQKQELNESLHNNYKLCEEIKNVIDVENINKERKKLGQEHTIVFDHKLTDEEQSFFDYIGRDVAAIKKNKKESTKEKEFKPLIDKKHLSDCCSECDCAICNLRRKRAQIQSEKFNVEDES